MGRSSRRKKCEKTSLLAGFCSDLLPLETLAPTSKGAARMLRRPLRHRPVQARLQAEIAEAAAVIRQRHPHHRRRRAALAERAERRVFPWTTTIPAQTISAMKTTHCIKPKRTARRAFWPMDASLEVSAKLAFASEAAPLIVEWEKRVLREHARGRYATGQWAFRAFPISTLAMDRRPLPWQISSATDGLISSSRIQAMAR